jgi:hypothetical protein
VPDLRAVFLGENGYPQDLEDAKKHLVAGREYLVEGGRRGLSWSQIKIAGRWYNAVMFDADFDALWDRFPYVPGYPGKEGQE